MPKTALDIEAPLQDLGSTDWKVRAEAAQVLGKSRNPAAVEPLMQALTHDTSYTVRSRAAVSLGKLKDPRAVEPLILALQAGNWQLFKHASAAITKIGAPAVPSLVRYADDRKQNAHLRQKCLELLGTLKGEVAAESLLGNMEDPDLNVRLQAIHSLGGIQNEKVFETLLYSLHHFSTPTLDGVPPEMRAGMQFSLRPAIEQTLVEALSKSQDERIIAPFVALLAGREAYGPDTEVLLAITNGLRQLSGLHGKTFAEIEAASSHSLAVTRIAAALSLCWLRDRRGLDPLRRLAQDEVPEVRAAASWSLAALEPSLSYNTPVLATVTDFMLR